MFSTPSLNEIEGILRDLMVMPTYKFSYEHCYRMVYRYSMRTGRLGMVHLVHGIVPGLVTTAIVHGGTELGYDTILTVLYDVLLYPVRVLKLSFEQFRDMIRQNLMKIVRPVQYLHDRSIGKCVRLISR